MSDFRKPRSATASNIDEAIPEIPGGRRMSHQARDKHGGSRRLSNPFNWRMRTKRQSADLSTMSLANAQKSNTVTVARPIYTQQHFDIGFGQKEHEGLNIKQRMKKCLTCECSAKCWKQFLYRLFPFISIMKNYSPREDLVGDIIAGMTVGIMNIPQGMAYALLASVPPIYGLYVSFFPVLVYFFFGGSRHISVGTFAVVSLMVGGAVDSQMDYCNDLVGGTPSVAGGDRLLNETGGLYNGTTADPGMTMNYTTMFDGNSSTTMAPNSAGPSNDPTEAAIDSPINLCRMGVVTTLTLLVGIFQVLMGLFRLGFVTIYLADPLISGFTTGAACHVFTSQVKYVLGIKVKRFNGALKLVYTYVDLFKNIATINWAEVICAALCIVILVLVKECINDRFKKKMKMPVPIDLIVVVGGTVISYLVDLNGRYEVKILGVIPKGFPVPSVPPMTTATALIPNAITIAIIAFAVSVSMSKIFGKRHNYEIDSNQELLALGFTNTISSFFSCFTSCASLSRSALQDNQGGKTQVAGLVSCSLILVVLIALGPYFGTLPNSVLAAIILVALKGMFKQFAELKRLWYISYYDFSIWLVTWLGVVFLDVDLGLIVGVVWGLLTVVFRTQYPDTTILARVPHTDLYKDKDLYPTVQEVRGVKIFRIDASLYYANVEHFRNKLYKQTDANPRKLKQQRVKVENKIKKEVKLAEQENKRRAKKAARQKPPMDDEICREFTCTHCGHRKAAPSLENMDSVGLAEEVAVDTDPTKRDGWPKPGIHHIIIDCSMMSYVDSVGVNMLVTVYSEYKDVDIDVLLVNCKSGVREMFRRCDFFDKMPPDNVYLTIHDAVIIALGKQRDLLEEVNRDTKIVSRPSSIYMANNSDRPPSMANILMARRASQPVQTFQRHPAGSFSSGHPLPVDENTELAEMDGENNEKEDPVNGEVSRLAVPTPQSFYNRKFSCHM